MAERSWETLEQPILEAVAEREDRQDSWCDIAAVAAQAGLPAEQVTIGVRRLLATDLLDGNYGTAYDGSDAFGLSLLPKGRQAVGQWPSSNPAEAFLQVLAHRIAVEEDHEVRGRLEKLRDSAGHVGKGVAAGIITAVVQQVSGLG